MSTSRILAFLLLALGLIATACGDSSLEEVASEGLRIENGGLLSHPQEDEFCLSLVNSDHGRGNILYYAAERSGAALIWLAVQTESGSDVYYEPEPSRLSNVVGLAVAMIPSSSLEVMFYSTAEKLFLSASWVSVPIEICYTNAERIAGAQPLAVLAPSSSCGPVSTGTREIALLYAVGQTIYSAKFKLEEITGNHPVLYRASEPIRTFSGEIASGGSFVPLSRIPALYKQGAVAESLGLLFSVRTARGDYDILASDLNGRTIRLKQVNSLGNDRSPVFDPADGSLYMVSDAFAPQLATRSLNIFRWSSLVFDGDIVSGDTGEVSSSSASASSASSTTSSSASSAASLPAPEMVSIPSGASITIGDSSVGVDYVVDMISAFEIGKYEISYSLWTNVRDWALEKGYLFSSPTVGRMGSAQTGTTFDPTCKHPVTDVGWSDAIVWCNALSQKFGYDPVYYKDASRSMTLSNAALVNLMSYDASYVDWSEDGYRLPTEVEWEYAARRKSDGGQQGGNKPSGYLGETTLDDPPQVPGQWGLYCLYSYNSQGHTDECGKRHMNNMGIYDMSGNVAEWCWNWYSASPDGGSGFVGADPTGPNSTTDGARVVRGGAAHSFYCNAAEMQSAWRTGTVSAAVSSATKVIGLRVVRRQ